MLGGKCECGVCSLHVVVHDDTQAQYLCMDPLIDCKMGMRKKLYSIFLLSVMLEH